MRIAHLSDVHVLDLTDVPVSRLLLNKRLTGWANLRLSRKDAHPQAILERLVADIGAAERPIDHVVVTGDLTNLSLEPELRRAREILAPLGGPDRLSVIPGNHDVYTRGAARACRFEAFFGDLMWPGDAQRLYPWHKDLGAVQLLGFCSAIPTPPLFAHGRVSSEQLARLDALAASGAFDDRFTIALTHHNLHPRRWRKDKMHGMRDRDAFLDACVRAGVDLLLHGHTHVAHRFERGALPVIGCGSSTWSSHDPAHTARYNVYDVVDGALAGIEVRRYDFATDAFAALEKASA